MADFEFSLHQSQRKAGVDGIVRVDGTRHGLVLEKPLLPVGQCRPVSTLGELKAF